MKTRIKIDITILFSTLILTLIFFQFPQLYIQNLIFDDVLDILGLLLILKGTLFRIVARGHKKFHSQQGEDLVITGIYRYVRHPMYLGTFLIGVGYIFIVWPVWSLPVFVIPFYLRFYSQIAKEEEHLKNLFGQKYVQYCQKVPGMFPTLKNLEKIKSKEIFNFVEVWDTKEKRGFMGWPILAFILEIFQEKIVFGVVDVMRTLMIFAIAVVLFVVLFYYQYQSSKTSYG